MAGHSSSGVGPTATLFETLEAWRQDRSSVVLANKVDEASAHVERLPVPPKLHRWWTDHARTYDPVTATTLLATVNVEARASKVGWRTIMLRDTPLVAPLRAAGFTESSPRNSEWMNLIDRIGLLLTWPDDPRVAMMLAELMAGQPFVSPMRMRPFSDVKPLVVAMVKRIAEIGDLRALARASLHFAHLENESKTCIVEAVARAPVPRTTHPRSLETAWQAVLDEPHALPPRLVLADAYMELDDPRGELIALQCAPLLAIEKARAAGESIDANGLFGAHADRQAALIATHWYHWFGEAALVVGRGARFHGGLLFDVTVGHAATPSWAWERVVDHRELCALRRMIVPRNVDLDRFADFVALLTRFPRWLRITSDMVAGLRERCGTLSLPGIELHDVIGGLSVAADRALALSPNLERLGLQNWYGDLADVRALAYGRPSLKLNVTVEQIENPAIVEELRALPNVKIISLYGS